MNSLDNLIPNSILDMMQLEQFDLELTVKPSPAGLRYPRVKVTVGTVIIFDGVVLSEKTIKYSNQFDKQHVPVTVEYYDKADTDTITDSKGNILEDQSVSISKMIVNGVDIVSSNIIYNLGEFTPRFSKEKYEYFIRNGLSTSASHTLNLYQNGVWQLDFKFPILANFVKYKAFQEEHEKWPDPEILNEIYDTIQRIRKTEK